MKYSLVLKNARILKPDGIDYISDIGIDDEGIIQEISEGLEHFALDYTHRISSASQYNLTEKRLEIFTSRGDTMVYEPSVP